MSKPMSILVSVLFFVAAPVYGDFTQDRSCFLDSLVVQLGFAPASDSLINQHALVLWSDTHNLLVT
jgi:hypothetical protein